MLRIIAATYRVRIRVVALDYEPLRWRVYSTDTMYQRTATLYDGDDPEVVCHTFNNHT